VFYHNSSMKGERKNRSKRGGDAGAWMAAVAGPANLQQGANGTSGMLQYNTNPALAVGGRRNRRGGTMFADLAVPAVLVYAQQNTPRSTKNTRRRRSNKRVTRRR
jgi:hypothetical protein